MLKTLAKRRLGCAAAALSLALANTGAWAQTSIEDLFRNS